MLCCGKERDTPYCPMCGTKLSEGTANVQALKSLITHCRTVRTTAVRTKNFYSTNNNREDLTEKQKERARHVVERENTKIEKWTKYITALEDAIRHFEVLNTNAPTER